MQAPASSTRSDNKVNRKNYTIFNFFVTVRINGTGKTKGIAPTLK